MTDEQLIYWLRGFFELSSEPPTTEQWGIIRAHLLGNIRFSTEPMPEAFKRVLDHGCKDCGPPMPGINAPLPTLDEDKLR